MVTYLLCGPTQEPVLATANTEGEKKKNSAKVLENADEWTGRVDISKEEIPGSKRSIHGHMQTYSRIESENF